MTEVAMHGLFAAGAVLVKLVAGKNVSA